MNDPVVDGIVEKLYGSDEEKQFLVCRGCGEAFDEITTAHQHGTFIAGPDPSWCGEAGFDIVPESEAM